ncbi:hypothetical protein DV736_g204, partial [Chaetothyriales sp. CBS 134916]
MTAVPFKVRAVFEYKSDEADDLSFANGQIITVTDDDDADWYTGEYTNATGEKVDGIFPRNFVEKYEPAIPSRPVRTPKRAPATDAQAQAQVEAQLDTALPPPVAASEAEADAVQLPAALPVPVEAQPGAARDTRDSKEAKDEAAAAHTAAAEPRKAAAPAPAARTAKPGRPPVGDKPSSSSFKDRIAAFNKAAAAPVAPFKATPPTASSGFVKKSFVAPPPSKNSYVPPPPRDIPPPKIYRREEDPSLQPEAERDGSGAAPPPAVARAENADEDQPKPTTLKERIALLQKQQLENAQRQADATAKKDKPRKPAKKRAETADEADPDAAPDTQPESLAGAEDTAKKAVAVAVTGDESEDARPPSPPGGQEPLVVPLPARELVSDTNDADDSGAADTEDGQETSTEEERLRHLRDRMAKMSGGMGMMGMFGPPAGLATAPPRKARQPGPEPQDDAATTAATARARPVPGMALPGMAAKLPKRQEDGRARPVPGLPLSPTLRAAPPPPPPSQPVARMREDDSDPDEEGESETPPPQRPQRQRSILIAASPASAPPVPPALSGSPTEAALRPIRVATSESVSKKHAEDESNERETEYDGDYDTDIASSAKYKDALKAHNRDSSIDDDVLTDDATKSPRSPPTRALPPLHPPSTGQRDHQPLLPPTSRKSMDAPKAGPPPVPPPKLADEDEYDPYRYSAPQQGLPLSLTATPQHAPTLSSPQPGDDDEDMYGAPSQPARPPPAPLDRPTHPPPMMAGGLGEPLAPPAQSAEIKRQPTVSRRSLDQSRPSGEYGIMASDIELAPSSFWWTQDNLLPPGLQNRHDFLHEMESSISAKRGGRTTVSRDVYVLYHDYSQTTINATFDQADPSHVKLEQNHQRPPPPPRKDQLEQASDSFGAKIASEASGYGAAGATVADGSAHGFVNALFQQLNSALKPVGIRAYGALVYANLANASTQQLDEIRPGDIVTFRHAKFAGHKGGLHQKYSLEVGKPDHAAVVIDWDGTKKKIRAWEQRGEDKGKKPKVREESFRVGDLKSGEVMVWRVMSRAWVGWDKS